MPAHWQLLPTASPWEANSRCWLKVIFEGQAPDLLGFCAETHLERAAGLASEEEPCSSSSSGALPPDSMDVGVLWPRPARAAGQVPGKIQGQGHRHPRRVRLPLTMNNPPVPAQLWSLLRLLAVAVAEGEAGQTDKSSPQDAGSREMRFMRGSQILLELRRADCPSPLRVQRLSWDGTFALPHLWQGESYR